ncbi:MAG: sugar phosphate isomerase/epimerase family protein [Desulfobacterales bacterium]|nr:sugar phosphate isomerase/epimerase family protein [Desulfobacterales bacterium]MDJ0856102.1 sugar phosphate isomerase/epimerase family protein [Desulfobacterales bacterium]MDJ0991622.1 sugar phosphate isomerase/epimerase family protein [Desulfobacterales bacterium]
MLKMGIITGFLSRTKDRFHDYNIPLELDQKFELMTEIEGYDGVEVVFPYEVNDPALTRRLLDKHRLNVAAINVNVKAEPEFKNGGLTSHNPDVRAKAVRFIKEAKDFAAAVGADKVTCCPLGDGYEFSFQYDYAQTWKYLVETFGAAGDYIPEIPLFVEYKPSETRGRCFVDSAAKTLCLLNDIQNQKMGVTLDFGHSIYGNEHPAEAVVMLAESPYPYYIHINDNDGKWDWDYFCGTKHYLEYVEFIYYLKKYGYSDYMTSDTSPTRWDIRGTFEANSRMTNKIWQRLEAVDGGKLEALMSRGDYLATWKFIEAELLGLK